LVQPFDWDIEQQRWKLRKGMFFLFFHSGIIILVDFFAFKSIKNVDADTAVFWMCIRGEMVKLRLFQFRKCSSDLVKGAQNETGISKKLDDKKGDYHHTDNPFK
jgi:hypothetical protein